MYHKTWNHCEQFQPVGLDEINECSNRYQFFDLVRSETWALHVRVYFGRLYESVVADKNCLHRSPFLSWILLLPVKSSLYGIREKEGWHARLKNENGRYACIKLDRRRIILVNRLYVHVNSKIIFLKSCRKGVRFCSLSLLRIDLKNYFKRLTTHFFYRFIEVLSLKMTSDSDIFDVN